MMVLPLETIPEETPTPTTNKNITSDVPKTKPATERNRLARDANKQAAGATNVPSQATNTATGSDQTESSNSSGFYILTAAGVIVSALGVYYQREAIMKTLGRNQTPAPAPAAEVNDETP